MSIINGRPSASPRARRRSSRGGGSCQVVISNSTRSSGALDRPAGPFLGTRGRQRLDPILDVDAARVVIRPEVDRELPQTLGPLDLLALAHGQELDRHLAQRRFALSRQAELGALRGERLVEPRAGLPCVQNAAVTQPNWSMRICQIRAIAGPPSVMRKVISAWGMGSRTRGWRLKFSKRNGSSSPTRSSRRLRPSQSSALRMWG